MAVSRSVENNTCYLAGPMRGKPFHNALEFDDAEDKLTRAGWMVHSPWAHSVGLGFIFDKDDKQIAGPNYNDSLKEFAAWDTAMVIESDCVVVLPDWQNSQGTKLEIDLANFCKMPVYAYVKNNGWSDGFHLDAIIKNVDTPSPTVKTVLEEATELVNGPRKNAYGDARDNFANIATGWSIVLGREVTAVQVALCMNWLKICRFGTNGGRDDLVDKAGYTALAAYVSGIDGG